MTTIHTSRGLGALVRGRRSERLLSQGDLAELAGVSRKWVVDVEGGKPTVELGLVLRLLDALDLDLRAVPRTRSADGRSDSPGTRTVDLDDLLHSYRR